MQSWGHSVCTLGTPGSLLGYPEQSWSFSWCILEQSLGTFCVHPRQSWCHPRLSWGHPGCILGQSSGHSGCILGNPEAILCHPEQSWGHPKCILGQSLRHSACILEILRPSWAIPNNPGAILGASWDNPWDILGASWRSWAILCHPEEF